LFPDPVKYPVRQLSPDILPDIWKMASKKKRTVRKKNSDNNFLYLLNVIRKKGKNNIRNSVEKNKILH